MLVHFPACMRREEVSSLFASSNASCLRIRGRCNVVILIILFGILLVRQLHLWFIIIFLIILIFGS